MKSKEIMTPNPKMCVPEDNVAVAVNLMWDYDCGVVPVVKDLESKELVGIVTDRDIAMYVVRHACVHPSQAKISDCMSSSVVVCQIKDPVETVIQLMGEDQIRRIPVVDQNGCCVGIISQADLLLHAIDIEPVIAVLQQISTPHSKSKKVAPVKPAATDETPATTKKKAEDIPDLLRSLFAELS